MNACGELINAGQQITRQEVLRLYTRDNGWFLREEEDSSARIEVGRLGDLVVLNRGLLHRPGRTGCGRSVPC